MNIDPALVAAVARQAGLDPTQADAAVAAVLRALAMRLPSPLFGQIQDHLAPRSAGAAVPAGGPPSSTAAAVAPATATVPAPATAPAPPPAPPAAPPS